MVKKRVHAEKPVHETKEKAEEKKALNFAKKLLRLGVIVPVIIALIAIIVILLLIKNTAATYSSVGDTVNLRYTFELEDGTVIEDGSDSLVVGGISQYFMLASDKLDQEIMKMKEGDNKTIILEAKDGSGEYSTEKIITKDRIQEINRTFVTPINVEVYIRDFNKTPEVGDTLQVAAYWNATIVEFNSQTNEAKLRHDLKEGGVLPLPPDGNVTIHVDEANDKIAFIYNPGKTLLVSGSALNVIDVNDQTFTFDANTPYAGKTVIVTLKVRGIEKAQGQTSDKPVADFFVFSYCPYGTQIEKALLPVYNLLKDKADINLVFIGAMHGEFEKIESFRQLCIQKNYGKDKLFSYLEEFLANTAIGNCGGQDSCLNPLIEGIYSDVGIDKNNIDSCMSTDAEALYTANEQKAQSLGIQSSPTVTINGIQSQVGRSPSLVQEAICSAFSTAPAECSQQLSSDEASPGFGSSSSSGSGASCG